MYTPGRQRLTRQILGDNVAIQTKALKQRDIDSEAMTVIVNIDTYRMEQE